jgi:hypothetical protein
MKRIPFLLIVVAVVAAIVVPTAGAKPLGPLPPQQARLDAARTQSSDGGWAYAAVAGGLAAVLATAIVVAARRPTPDAPVTPQSAGS